MARAAWIILKSFLAVHVHFLDDAENTSDASSIVLGGGELTDFAGFNGGTEGDGLRRLTGV